LDQSTLRTRYRELAKRLHPDVNAADRGAEDRLKDVNRAYSLLRQRVRNTAPVPEAAEAGAAS
jgi:curved DNA-binding protein CbpA